MKRLLSAVLLFSAPAFAVDTSLLGYTTQQGTKFFGIHMSSGMTEMIPLTQMNPHQRQVVQACVSSINTNKAVQVVVDFVPQYSSDVRTLSLQTGLPSGYEGTQTVIKSVSCAPVGIHFESFWKAALAKSKNKR